MQTKQTRSSIQPQTRSGSCGPRLILISIVHNPIFHSFIHCFPHSHFNFSPATPSELHLHLLRQVWPKFWIIVTAPSPYLTQHWSWSALVWDLERSDRSIVNFCLQMFCVPCWLYEWSSRPHLRTAGLEMGQLVEMSHLTALATFRHSFLRHIACSTDNLSESRAVHFINDAKYKRFEPITDRSDQAPCRDFDGWYPRSHLASKIAVLPAFWRISLSERLVVHRLGLGLR